MLIYIYIHAFFIVYSTPTSVYYDPCMPDMLDMLDICKLLDAMLWQ